MNRYGYEIVKNENYWKLNPSGDINVIDYYETVTGNYYLYKNTPYDAVANAIKNNLVFEKEVVDIASRYVKPGTVVLDVGANYGQMAVLFSRMVGHNGLVYAFEAQKAVFSVLEKNIEANKLANVKLIYGAVYNKDNEILLFPAADLHQFGAFGSYGIDPASKSGQKVNSITIDSLCIEQPISFMKVDIQGCDLFALQGAVETIKKHKMPIIFEFEQQFQEDFGTNFGDYVDFVARIGYKFDRTVLDINYLIVPK